MYLLRHPVGFARGAAVRLLDFFVRQPSTPWVPIAVYVPLAVAALVWNLTGDVPSGWVLIGLPVIGFFLWTLLEYFLHSRGFHSTLDSPWLQQLGKSHRAHHTHPSDPGRIIARLSFSLPVTLLFWGVLTLVLWSPKLAALLMSGMMLGYLAYEIVHYLIHRSKLFRKTLRPLVRHHLYHHHKDEERCYGVTSPLWDVVFGTMPRQKVKEPEEESCSPRP